MKLISADILKAHMKHKDFSMDRLATYAGCSKSMIGHLCTGLKSSCTPKLAENIARALDLPVEALFVQQASAPRGQNTRPARAQRTQSAGRGAAA